MLLNVPYHKETNHATEGFISLSRKNNLENVKGNVIKCLPLVDIHIFNDDGVGSELEQRRGGDVLLALPAFLRL